MEHMGQRVKYLLDSKKISNKDFAERMGVSKQYIAELLMKEQLTFKTVGKIAKAIDVEFDSLFNVAIADSVEPKDLVEDKAGKYGIGFASTNFDKAILEHLQVIAENVKLKNKVIELQDEIIKLRKKNERASK